MLDSHFYEEISLLRTHWCVGYTLVVFNTVLTKVIKKSTTVIKENVEKMQCSKRVPSEILGDPLWVMYSYTSYLVTTKCKDGQTMLQKIVLE